MLSAKMDTEEEKKFIAQIKEAIARKRGYADFFCWPPNRDLEEFGIVSEFCESLEKNGQLFFNRDSVKGRGRGNDPPDFEAKDLLGNYIGIEVTELVDFAAIETLKNTGVYEWAEWDRAKIIRVIDERLSAKDKPAQVKGGPYVSYVIIIHTDEPSLNVSYITSLLKDVRFTKRKLIDRAFLFLSPDPEIKIYPYVELEFST